jgi:hypothetical protein
MKIKTLILLFFLFFLTSIEVNSAQVTIAWDPVDDTRVTGYELDYGLSSKTYTIMIGTGNVTQYVITGLADNTTYYIAAKTLDTKDGIQSDFSNEIAYTTPCAYSISPTSSSFNSTGGTGSISITTQSTCKWTVSTPADWVSITSGISGIGNGTINYSVSTDPGGGRIQSFTISGQIFTVTQTASKAKYIITASSGTGGSISPSGRVSSAAGSSKTFIIKPNKNYSISSVTVDGNSLGVISSYTFTNISANHTIKATFIRKK